MSAPSPRSVRRCTTDAARASRVGRSPSTRRPRTDPRRGRGAGRIGAGAPSSRPMRIARAPGRFSANRALRRSKCSTGRAPRPSSRRRSSGSSQGSPPPRRLRAASALCSETAGQPDVNARAQARGDGPRATRCRATPVATRLEVMRLSPRSRRVACLAPVGVEVGRGGRGLPLRRKRRGDLGFLERLRFAVLCPYRRCRAPCRSRRSGRRCTAATSRRGGDPSRQPCGSTGYVVAGDQRGRGARHPTAKPRPRPATRVPARPVAPRGESAHAAISIRQPALQRRTRSSRTSSTTRRPLREAARRRAVGAAAR